jgi:hypothetical protein
MERDPINSARPICGASRARLPYRVADVATYLDRGAA